MKTLKQHLKPLDSVHEAMIERTIGWANINSGTDNIAGLKKTAEAIVPTFEQCGLSLQVIPADPVTIINDKGGTVSIERGPSYHLSNRPEANRRILLTGHLDTVFPASSPFQKVQKRKDGTIHGPGCADMKGGICVMLEALRTFEQSPFANSVGIDVLLNSDEETGSHASAKALTMLAKQADVGMVFEPALPDGTLAGARAGSGHYTFTVQGLAAHAGREFDKGRNAILGAAKVIEAINTLNGQRDGTTLNLGVISGGVATNVVPDTCIVRMNIRGLQTADLQWVDGQIRDVIANGSFGVDIEVDLHGGIHRPVKKDDGGTGALFELVKSAGGELGMAIAWKPTGGCCDGNNLAAAGLPNVDTLGVCGGLIHSPEEFAVMSSFTERAKLSAMVMMMLASGAHDWPQRV